MVKHQFNNVHDVILCALFLLFHRFHNEDWLFAAHCILWLASKSQYTELLSNYQRYKIFPSAYIINCEITPLPNPESKGSSVPEPDIPELDLNTDSGHPESNLEIGSDIEDHALQSKLLPKHRITKSANLNTTHLERVFIFYREPTNCQLIDRFTNLSSQQKRLT